MTSKLWWQDFLFHNSVTQLLLGDFEVFPGHTGILFTCSEAILWLYLHGRAWNTSRNRHSENT